MCSVHFAQGHNDGRAVRKRNKMIATTAIVRRNSFSLPLPGSGLGCTSLLLLSIGVEEEERVRFKGGGAGQTKPTE